MYKFAIALVCCVMFSFSMHAQNADIRINTTDLEETNYLQADNFYLIHYLYVDIFLRENLFEFATPTDVRAVLSVIKKYASPKRPLEIQFKRPDNQMYVIRVAILKKETEELLIVFTNWDTPQKKFTAEVGGETTYTRWYYLNGTKMTYRKDMSKEHNYKTNNKVELANALLFDELSDNDAQIQPTLNALLSGERLRTEDEITAHLLQLKYHMWKGNGEGVKKEVGIMDAMFANKAVRDDYRGLNLAYNTTKFQLQLMSR